MTIQNIFYRFRVLLFIILILVLTGCNGDSQSLLAQETGTTHQPVITRDSNTTSNDQTSNDQTSRVGSTSVASVTITPERNVSSSLQPSSEECENAKKYYFGPVRIERDGNNVVLEFNVLSFVGGGAPLSGVMDEAYAYVKGGQTSEVHIRDETSGSLTIPIILDGDAHKPEVTIRLYNWSFYESNPSSWDGQDEDYWNSCTIPLGDLPESSVFEGCPSPPEKKQGCFDLRMYDAEKDNSLKARELCLYGDSDPQKPGDFSANSNIKTDEISLLSYGWCAKDEGTLDENMSEMFYEWTIDGAEVDLNQLGKTRKSSRGGNLACEIHTGVLTGLVPGRHEIVQIRHINHTINDGLNTYEAGDYVFHCDVYVR